MLMPRDKQILRHIENYGHITISQCANIFFTDSICNYDLARKRLKKIYNMDLIKYYTNGVTNEKIYCFKDSKKPSAHNILLMNFYAKLILNKCKILSFDVEKNWLDNRIRSDAFFKIENNNLIQIGIIEVDLTHSTDINKYVELYNSKLLQTIYNGIFPPIYIIKDKEIKSKDIPPILNVISLNYNLDNFSEKVLAI